MSEFTLADARRLLRTWGERNPSVTDIAAVVRTMNADLARSRDLEQMAKGAE